MKYKGIPEVPWKNYQFVRKKIFALKLSIHIFWFIMQVLLFQHKQQYRHGFNIYFEEMLLLLGVHIHEGVWKHDNQLYSYTGEAYIHVVVVCGLS